MVEDLSSTEVADEVTIEGGAVEDIRVDGGYGWVNVACMLLLTANTWGVNGVGSTLFSRLVGDTNGLNRPSVSTSHIISTQTAFPKVAHSIMPLLAGFRFLKSHSSLPSSRNSTGSSD